MDGNFIQNNLFNLNILRKVARQFFFKYNMFAQWFYSFIEHLYVMKFFKLLVPQKLEIQK